MTVISAVAVVTFRNIIYAGFSLLATFMGVAAIYVFAKADFIAVTQIVVYVGGILVLLLFGVMLTNRVSSQKITTDIVNVIPGVIIAGIVFATLVSVMSQTNFESLHWIQSAKQNANVMKATDSSLQTIGIQTMSNYVFPFEVISIVLMVALMGAAYISRREAPQVRKLK